MKIQTIEQVEDFLEAVNACKDSVYLTSVYGDKFNLKSLLSQYVAIAALLGEHGDELELFCASREDEPIMMKFFKEHRETI